MPQENALITIHILSKGGMEPIPATLLAKAIEKLTKVINLAGVEISQIPIRQAGQFPSVVTKRCNLYVKDLKMGSATLTLENIDPQQTLEGPQLGIQAINLTHNILSDIEKSTENMEKTVDHLQKRIDNKYRAKRMLDYLKETCYAKSSPYQLELLFGSESPFVLDYRKKEIIRDILKKYRPDSGTEEIFGRIVQAGVDKPAKFWVEALERKWTLKYNPKLASYITKLMLTNKFVRVVGQLEKRSSYANPVLLVKEMKQIKEIDNLPINNFQYGNVRLILKEPLYVTPVYDDDDCYVVSNDELNIHGTGETLREAISMVKDYLTTLWEMYAICPEEELAEESLPLRKKLQEIVEPEE